MTMLPLDNKVLAVLALKMLPRGSISDVSKVIAEITSIKSLALHKGFTNKKSKMYKLVKRCS